MIKAADEPPRRWRPEDRLPPFDAACSFGFAVEQDEELGRRTQLVPRFPISPAKLCDAMTDAGSAILQMVAERPKAQGRMTLEFPAEGEEGPRLSVWAEKASFYHLMQIVTEVVRILLSTEGLPKWQHLQIVAWMHDNLGNHDDFACAQFAETIATSWIKMTGIKTFREYSVWDAKSHKFVRHSY